MEELQELTFEYTVILYTRPDGMRVCEVYSHGAIVVRTADADINEAILSALSYVSGEG